MVSRGKDSKLSGSSANGSGLGRLSGDGVNRPPIRETRGSGSDLNSDSKRLEDFDNLMDKEVEDSFPASDPPSFSPVTGVGRGHAEPQAPSRHKNEPSPDFINDPQAQFKYGRKSQAATHHFDRSSRRLERGNPDIGEVDLGNIEADRPADPDDRDPYD